MGPRNCRNSGSGWSTRTETDESAARLLPKATPAPPYRVTVWAQGYTGWAKERRINARITG